MIRKFGKEDTEQVMRIWLEGNREAHNFISEDYWVSQYPLVQEQLLQAEVYVYEQDGKVQGFAGMTGNYLAGIFVEKKSRFLGIGKLLLAYIKKVYPVFSLHVYRKNQPAVHFYRREGLSFAEEGIEEHTGEAEYTMVWNRNGCQAET